MKFPYGMDGPTLVDPDPANMLRDVFFRNLGRIPAQLVENMLRHHTPTYGGNVLRETWDSLRSEGYLSCHGGDWIWSVQEAMALRDLEDSKDTLVSMLVQLTDET